MELIAQTTVDRAILTIAMTYPEALSHLGEARRFGMKLGLEPMRDLARALGDPQKQLRFIHLAGTNGKGSTAAFCESCLRAAGFRVGLYTSPHLVSIRERIQIGRSPISEEAFAEGMEAVRRAVGETRKHEETFFELTTALALWYFAREKVDWVVWETGLGGRFDATNIVTPEICIITNIGLDHQQYLGSTLRKIAIEKAGIIKHGVPVVSAVEPGEASDVIQKQARAERSVLTLVHRDMEIEDLGLRGDKQIARIDGAEFALGLIGPHQVSNAACAAAAMKRLELSHAAIACGLESAVWAGRFEILSETPLIVLDGAHNPAGMKMLVETWRAFLAARYGWTGSEVDSRAHLVFASVADKDISEMAQLIRPLVRHVSLVRLANERGAEPSRLAPAFSGLPCECYDSVSAWWREVATASTERATLITGSLFLVGEMLAHRQGSAGEYHLNERLEAVAII
jgi:dihydrofolate synthase/folylpolyglutamate synthase